MDGISPRYSGLLEQYSSLPEKKKKIVRLFLEKEGVDFFNLPIFPGNGKNDDFPLSSTQQGMWFLDRLAPRNPFYNVPLCFYLEGPLDAGILRKSVDRVVQRHEVLRTSFPTVDGKPAPRIESGLMWNIRVRDGSHLPEAEWRRRVAEMADEEAMRPFDLDEAPLFRVVLYRYNEQKHFFQWTFHHMVIDGWSIGVLLRELSSWFARFAGAGGEKPPELTVQYADFAAWQRAALEGAHVQAQLRYWEKRLQHAETLSLPLDHPRPAVQTYRGEAIMFRFPKPRNQGLEKLREREGASLFMVLLAVFKLLLSGYSGQENIVVGTPTANRGRKELENLIGFFSNSLALSTDLSGDPDFSQLAARVKKGVLEDFANQDAPFERVVERLGVERDPSKSALFQVLFVLQNFTLDEFTLPGLTAAPHSLNFATTHFDLELHFWDEKDHLKGALFYNVDLFERETMVRLHSDYQDLLQRAAADPDQPVSSLLKEIAGREKWRRPRLHLADLLPGWRRFETSEEPIDADGSDVSGPRVDPAAYKGPMALSAGPPLTIPEDAPETLTEALIRSADDGSKGVVCFQERGARVFLSYAEILADAKSILAGLQARGCGPGDRMILQIGRLQDHFSAFWACALGGVIPVTVAVSPAFDRRNSVVNKLWNIWDLLSHPPILTNEGLAEDLAGVPSLYPDHPAAAENRFEVLSIESLRRDASDARLHPCKPDDVIFYQLTSGSTGVPKCIQETHRGIIHHIHGSREWNGYTPEDVTLNWLPMDHVVPILTIHLKDVYMGIREVHVKTDLVLREPLLWLDLMASEGVTHTWAPNFGFKLVSDRLADQRNGRGDGRGDGQWDLSRLKFCMNAGEQVTLPVVEEFLERTAPLGVRPRVMQPSFGMAEACTCMTYLNDFDVASGVHRVSKASLGGVLEESADPKNAIDFVDLGKPMHGVEIRITDDRNRMLPESVIGRFQIKGRVITPGYYKNDKANQEAFVGDDWFNSGDLGFIKNGSLTLT
ncbi:MAG: AMP-binding protein, partial [Desulfobacterales bacterium]|nr:AMP-binding protein [Desulfobacterales bacterium]